MNREIKFRAISAEVIFNRGRYCLATGTFTSTLIPEMCEVIGNIIEKKGKRVK